MLAVRWGHGCGGALGGAEVKCLESRVAHGTKKINVVDVDVGVLSCFKYRVPAKVTRADSLTGVLINSWHGKS